MVVNEGCAIRVNRREVVLPLLVANVNHALARKELSVTAIAGRHNTVKHIHSASDTLQDVYRCADTHQIARLILWQHCIHNLNHRVHHLRRLSYGQTANGVTVGVVLQHILRRLGAQVGVTATLHNREERLIVAILRLGLVILIEASVKPSLGQGQRLGGILLRSVTRRALIKGHHNIGTDGALGIYHAFGRKEVARAVNMRLEVATLLLQLATRRKREDLKASTIGQHRPLPR